MLIKIDLKLKKLINSSIYYRIKDNKISFGQNFFFHKIDKFFFYSYKVETIEEEVVIVIISVDFDR